MSTDLRRRVVVFASLVLSIAPRLSAQMTGSRDEPVIEAAGHGEARVAPDRATVGVSVETKGSTAAAVGAANAVIQRRILDTLRAMGYSGAQVSTVGYSVSPDYEPAVVNGPPKRRGYTARNAVEVKVAQLDRIGSVIDAALARGATGVDDITFDVANRDAPRQAALTDAVVHARADALTLAKAMGGTLGRLIALTTQEQQPGYPRLMAQAARSVTQVETSITPGALSVDASVIGRWQFVPAP
jgi:uncharacterized protein